MATVSPPTHLDAVRGSNLSSPSHTSLQLDSQQSDGHSSDEEEFVYPGSTNETTEDDAPLPIDPSAPSNAEPSPAQLEALHAAASSGDLSFLRRLFQNAVESGNVQPFNLANHASTRTGATVLHAAAARGYLEIVQWLIEDCGAIPDLEDKEGETALHKAALNGHLPVISYLLPERASAHARDADGWTALHNACSKVITTRHYLDSSLLIRRKGYLDIVRWLCEHGGSATEVDGVTGIDSRSKGGWTPLMNAASKGHLPVVLYLLTKQGANPLVRNNWGETAYDVAAAVFEVWICEVLLKAERDRWPTTSVPYNPLAVHITVPLIVYENQKLDTRLKTLAVSGGRPKFSASGLGKQGRRAPFELRLPLAEEETNHTVVPAWRSDVRLPALSDPFKLPKVGHRDRPAVDGVHSHFWLSDWTLDVTHPGVDAEEGWQYSHHFNDSDEMWVADQPPPLVRLLTGSATHSTSSIDPSRSQPSGSRTPQTWVRRRRWVRVMRRRLDIPPLPFLEPDGVMYDLNSDGSLTAHASDAESEFDNEGEGQELSTMPVSFSHNSRDYVARARYIVGSQLPDPDPTQGSGVEIRRTIAKLERATSELRQGILADDDADRKTQAEVLLHALNRDLERKRLAAGANGLLISGDDVLSHEDEDDSSSDEEFHYPGASPLDTVRSPSRASSSTDYFTRSSAPRLSMDLTPQKFSFRDGHLQHLIKFMRSGRETLMSANVALVSVVSTSLTVGSRTTLDPSDIVQDPLFPESSSSASMQRVCQTCYDIANASVPSGLYTSRTTSVERIVIEQARLAIPSHMSRNHSSSQLSDLADCPVCGQTLSDLDTPADQEAHVKTCLEGGSGTSQQPVKYLVYELPSESVLIGMECVICLEEFMKGSLIARLSCLCSFHNACLSSWLQRGRSCPVHAR
ncbi:hypothetical protein ONZ45_g35 [Pleurotus djamor]|nr:hypothetical protein ONZ45_g35 [Pleurotus djamor]